VNTKKKKLCDRKPIRKNFVEEKVVEHVMKMLHDDAMVEYIVDTVMELDARESTVLPLLTRQLEETNKAIGNMLNAIQQGIFNTSTKERLDELEATKSDLEIQILQEQMQKPPLDKVQLTFWICRFRETDITIQEQRQRLVDIFVNSVYIYDDHMTVNFNYRDGTVTISLRDVEAAGLGSSLSCLGAPPKLFIRLRSNANPNKELGFILPSSCFAGSALL